MGSKLHPHAATVFGVVMSGCAHENKHDHPHEHAGFHRHFDDAEKWAKVFDAPDRDAWQHPDEVVALLELAPNMKVADLGAGTGYFLARLSRAVGPGGRVLGLDVEPDMIAYMKKRAEHENLTNVEARVVDPADPKLDAGTIDRILIVDTWHHIDDRLHYAAKLKEALAPGGAIFVVDFTLEASQGPPKEHRLSADAVIAELTECGLKGEVVSETLPDQYIVRGFVPAP